MNLDNRFTPRNCSVNSNVPSILMIPAAVLSTLVVLILAVAPAIAQTGNQLELRSIPTQAGIVKSEALGIAASGSEPLTLVGAVETTGGQSKASCWIRVSQQWTAHELPGLDPNGNSWGLAVVHVPWTGGEHTIVAGSADNTQGTRQPMTWSNVTNQPWTGHALPTLNGGDGEARGLFLPDGTPVRALYCGWAGETPPMSAKGAPRAAAMKVAVPVIWETTSTGERVMKPEYGVGLAGHANDICSTGVDSFIAVGGGETASGSWRPQVWMSVDDGQSWQNTELPLPPAMDRGEANACGSHELGHILLVSGYGESSSGARVPLLWEIDLDGTRPTWIVHELPLPAGKEGGQNNYVHKLPGRVKYAGAVVQNGAAELALWTDDPTGWIVEGPADYLVNPEAGTPISAAGFDALGRIAVTAQPPEPVAFATSATQPDTLAAVLIPSPPTSVAPVPAPRKLIALTASPNPFNPLVRIVYTLPRDGRVTVKIKDAAGRLVKTLDERYASVGIEHTIDWDGTPQSGNRTISGVYFVRVVTGYEIATAKIVLVK